MRNRNKYIFVSIILCLLSSQIFALAPQTSMTWIGQYDVKMISSQGLQAVYLSGTNPQKAIRPMTDDEMRTSHSINNYISTPGTGFSDGMYALTKPVGATAIGQIYADRDEDPNTFQSSCAYLDFGADMACTKVKAAYLYWTSHEPKTGNTIAAHNGVGLTLNSIPAGNWEGLTTPVDGYGLSTHDYVLFKPQGATVYTPVHATRTNINPDAGGERKICFADVTTLVQNRMGGMYWVANLRSGFAKGAGGATSAWTLVVIFQPPNCPPRTIKFWDGMEDIGGGGSKQLDLGFNPVTDGLPNSLNSVSYLGIAVLDGENIAGDLLVRSGASIEYLDVWSENASGPGTIFKINPFANGQTAPNPGEPQLCKPAYTYAGVLLNSCAYDGFSCSRISSYDPELGTNGNPINRSPNQLNTLGYDAHHIRLPAGVIKPLATKVSLKYYAGDQGSTMPFMAYMAIETVQANLLLGKKTENSPSVGINGEVTYVLTTKNIGPKASTAGAYILDELDKTCDFVPGSVAFYDKTMSPITPNFTIINQGADVNELLTFTLPSIGAGTGTTATDSITVKFKVKIKGYDRTDIWGYGCNRYTKNKATLTYKADNGSDLQTGSNSGASCTGQGSYFQTPIIDLALEQQYNETHNVEDTLTQEVEQANSNGTKLYINKKIKEILAEKLAILLMPVSDTSKYVIANEDGLLIPNSQYFTQVEAVQKYTATANLGAGCEDETFYFTIVVAKIPKYLLDPVVTKPEFPGDPSGGFTVKAYGGDPGYSLKVYNGGSLVYNAYSTAAESTTPNPNEKTFNVDCLPAGTYTFVVGDQGSISSTPKTVVIPDKDPITLSINGTTQVCVGRAISLTAVPNRTVSEFAWYESTDNTNWTELVGQTSNTLSLVPTNSITYYKAFACDGAINGSASVQVNSLPTPIVDVLATDSGCYQFNLVNLEVTERNNMPASDYVLTLHNQEPTSATDNRYLITANKYNIKKTQNVWARMSVNNLCYSTAMGQVFVKSMEQCHPIIIQDFFSPDGDGLNDRWLVGGLEEYTNPEIIVYDRYGKVVFKGGKEDVLPPNGWDGTYLGNPLPSADYWYQMNFLEIETKVGHFTLKRRKE